MLSSLLGDGSRCWHVNGVVLTVCMSRGRRWLQRLIAVLVCVFVALVVPPPPPAAACSCFGDIIQMAQELGTPELVFSGSVVDSGPSNVTAAWSEPPQSGVALLIEVDAVRVGDLGATVVVHAPGGIANSGNCSIGVPAGPQLVVTSRDAFGFVRGGLCSVFPIGRTPTEADLTAAFGPERPFNPLIDAELLIAGVARAPDSEDLGARAVYEQYNGLAAAREEPVGVEGDAEPQMISNPPESTDVFDDHDEAEGSGWFQFALAAGLVALGGIASAGAWRRSRLKA